MGKTREVISDHYIGEEVQGKWRVVKKYQRSTDGSLEKRILYIERYRFTGCIVGITYFSEGHMVETLGNNFMLRVFRTTEKYPVLLVRESWLNKPIMVRPEDVIPMGDLSFEMPLTKVRRKEVLS